MGRRVHDHDEMPPASRRQRPVIAAEFFPGEVARLLGLDDIDYSQLRELFVLARTLRGQPKPGRGWARFTLADLAATEVLVTLGGGRTALRRGRRLVLGHVEATCLALHQLGFNDPLLQVPLARQGRRILARIDGYIIEPTTGQLVLDDVEKQIKSFFKTRLITDRHVRSAIQAERRRIRPRRTRRLEVLEEWGTLDALG